MRSLLRLLVLLLIVGAALAVARALKPHPPDLAGQVSVIDGDTIRLQGSRVRLSGIDAPEHDQLCLDAAGRTYQCGAVAANRLSEWIDRRAVTCTPLDRDQYDRTDATCSVGGQDIGEWLVSNGLAIRYPQFDREGRYVSAEERARASHAGLWRGRFREPWQYRGCLRSGSRPTECSMLHP